MKRHCGDSISGTKLAERRPAAASQSRSVVDSPLPPRPHEFECRLRFRLILRLASQEKQGVVGSEARDYRSRCFLLEPDCETADEILALLTREMLED